MLFREADDLTFVKVSETYCIVWDREMYSGTRACQWTCSAKQYILVPNAFGRKAT